jgi:hypothetical protein
MRICLLPVIVSSALTLCGCVATTSPASFDGAAISHTSVAPIATVGDGWYPGESIVHNPIDPVLVKPGEPTTARLRRGVTPEGFSYDYYEDGSGSLDVSHGTLPDWDINCVKDKINDQRRCTIARYEGEFLVAFDPGGKPASVCAIYNDFPGRTGALRVDAQDAVKTDEHGCAPASAILPAMLGGASITVRAIHWPYDYPRDDSAKLAGLSQAISLTKFIYTHIDKLSF